MKIECPQASQQYNLVLVRLEIKQNIVIMQHSKQKAPCAYAKAGKSRSKIPHNKSEVPPSPRNKKCENMYEEIMKDLDLEQSEYILRLCKKNEEKMKKNQTMGFREDRSEHFQDVSNLLSESSQKSINPPKKETPRKSKTQIPSPATSKRNSKMSKKSPHLQTPPTIQPTQQQYQSQFSSYPSEKSLNPYFLSNLDNYIARLNENEQRPQQFFEKTVLHKYSSQNERQFRRTVQIPTSKGKKCDEQLVSRAKYSKLLDNLHEEIVEKQALEYKLQCKDIKMAHMKDIIQSMHHEITILQGKLHQEKEEKQKYSKIAQEFVSKVHHARTSSRQKHYIPQHYKRNSHVPSSNSYNNEFNDYFNRTGWQDGKSMAVLKNDFQRRDRQEISTLKKKGMHKYKISEICNEGNESMRDRASIYNDSYL